MLNLTQNANTQTFLEGEKSKTKVIILKDERRVLSLGNPSHFKYHFKSSRVGEIRGKH